MCQTNRSIEFSLQLSDDAYWIFYRYAFLFYKLALHRCIRFLFLLRNLFLVCFDKLVILVLNVANQLIVKQSLTGNPSKLTISSRKSMRHFGPTFREIQLVQASTVLKPKHLSSRFVRAEIHLSIPRRYHEVRAMIKIYKVAAVPW